MTDTTLDDLDTWEEIISCSVCGSTNLVLPHGPKDAEILLIGEFPGKEEIKIGKPMVGAMGGVLRTELGRVGIDIRSCRKTNLWLHEPNKNPECMKDGMAKAILEAKTRKAVLLIGSETVKAFTGKSVSNLNGLVVQSDYIKVPLIMAMFNPAIAFHSSIGELRLAIEKFANKLEGLHG